MMGDSMEKETNKKTTSAKKKNTSSKSNLNNKNNAQNTKKKKKGNKNIVQSKKVEVKEEKVKEAEIKEEIVSTETPAAKETSKKKKSNLSNNEFVKLLQLILIVTGIFLAFYLVTWLFTDNSDKNKKEEEKPEVSIQYDEILMSNLLKQKDLEYYVLAYDAEDKYYDSYNMYIYTYSTQKDAKRVYTSVLSNGFNKKFYDKELKESVIDAADISKLKLKDTSLIRVRRGTIRNVYEGHEEIINFLSTLGK